MGDVAIRVEGISKRYGIGQREGYLTLRDSLMRSWRSAFNLFRDRVRTETEKTNNYIWALKDVSLEVTQGEVVGIIGRNGAGKTTLLKILSRITEPTEGYAKVWGQVGSLLEVGTGFHPELTGRENLYLNGAILGMKKREIDKKFDEIVDFAEIEKFIDTPVKHYSSGMYVRLAFAVAAHLEPEIMLVDEVLAVGDAAFQKKCLGKMGDVAKEGRTVLFVSHNMAAVENLCKRGVVLRQGEVVYIGSQTGAISHYLSSLEAQAGSLRTRSDRIGTGEVRVVDIEFRDMSDRCLDTVRSGQDVDVYLHYETSGKFQQGNIVVGIMIRTQLDVPVFLQHNRLTGNYWDRIPPKGAFVCRLKRLPLTASLYHVGFSVLKYGGREYLDRISDAVELAVIEGDFFGSGEVPPASHGFCLVDADWRLEPLK